MALDLSKADIPALARAVASGFGSTTLKGELLRARIAAALTLVVNRERARDRRLRRAILRSVEILGGDGPVEERADQALRVLADSMRETVEEVAP